MLFEVVIGLEVHVQLNTKSKLFCTAGLDFGGQPNSRVGVASLGLPGALPVLNEQALECAVKAALVLDAQIPEVSFFERKHYFYPDLPKGYQITQLSHAMANTGTLSFSSADGAKKSIRINRIQLEEDAGKSQHTSLGTLVDLNRAGAPLIEIVFEPDLRSPSDAACALRSLHERLCAAGVTQGNMEEGQFRCDANVSVRKLGDPNLGTRAEIKNLNSFRFLEKAVDFEAARQITLIQSGSAVIQETRGFDAAAGKTFSMRRKEDADDYRYMPDPDLPPIIVSKQLVASIRSNLPDMPEATAIRLRTLGVLEFEADQISGDRELESTFHTLVAMGLKPETAARLVVHEMRGFQPDETPPLKQVAELFVMVDRGEISQRAAKPLLAELKEVTDVLRLVKERNLLQVSDVETIRAWVHEFMAREPAVIDELRAGNEKLRPHCVGQIMKVSKGKASPQLVSQILEEELRK